ncbi:MAG TPA: hypothetical protein VKY74_02830, partial [Chloroflexia bacterium]|nr:hypothetical protein [Chloroflexia bacterium]
MSTTQVARDTPGATHAPARPATRWIPRGRSRAIAADRLMPGLLFLLAFGFMAPGLLPGRVAAPMAQLLVYPPWAAHYPDLRAGVNPVILGGDLLLQQLPWRHWMQQELAAGRFPLWAPGPLGGMPLFASSQPAVLYPLHLLWIVLPIGAGLGLILALKLWLAGLGMWGFLRALRLQPAAAAYGALGFMFSGWLVDWLPWENSGLYLLLPWLAWAVEAWCHRGRRPALVALAGLTACAILAGHPETLFIVGLTTILWAGGLTASRPWRCWPGIGAGLALAGGLGTALGAIQLLPFFEVFGLSQAATGRPAPDLFAQLHLDASSLLFWVFPRFGAYVPDHIAGGRDAFTVANGYIGLVAILGVALAGGAALRRQVRGRLLAPWVAIGLLAWLITYDDALGTTIRRWPGLNQSINEYWLGSVAFAGLIISAFGWDWLARTLTP